MNVRLTRTRALLATLALAMAVLPVRAAERQPDTGRASETQEEKPSPPQALQLPSLRQALKGLKRLRLHPGRDNLDLSETARNRPRTDAE
jgi:hypothetical protein